MSEESRVKIEPTRNEKGNVVLLVSGCHAGEELVLVISDGEQFPFKADSNGEAEIMLHIPGQYKMEVLGE